MRFAVAASLAAAAVAAYAAAVPDAPQRPAAAQPTPPPPADVKFYAFVRAFRQAALDAGISNATYDTAMSDVTRNQRVEDLNLNQPEFSKPVWSYLDTAVSAQRIAAGQQALANNLAMLTAIEAKYGVPKEVLISIWGNESNFGQAKESFNMFEALATLAYDGPRTDYARPQLIAALKMMQQKNYSPLQMTSSWAGAFGQTQFVPTTFLAHAVDGDGDGRIDLWGSTADALASAAAVLSDAGWQRGNVWGYEIILPKDFAYDQADLDTAKSVSDWKKRGVTTATGGDLPRAEEYGAIYLPAGAHGPAFLVFDNFKVILKYNNAAAYALAVSTLADQIMNRPAIAASWPRDELPMTRDQRMMFQTALQKLGYEVGTVDGVLGRKARTALRTYQKANGLPADGFATLALLDRLSAEVKAKSL